MCCRESLSGWRWKPRLLALLCFHCGQEESLGVVVLVGVVVTGVPLSHCSGIAVDRSGISPTSLSEGCRPFFLQDLFPSLYPCSLTSSVEADSLRGMRKVSQGRDFHPQLRKSSGSPGQWQEGLTQSALAGSEAGWLILGGLHGSIVLLELGGRC